MQENSNFSNYKFIDREEATIQLCSILPKDKMQRENWLLIALSKGAILMVEKIAKELSLEYDVLILIPILAPNNNECQIAMVSETQEIVLHGNLVRSFNISKDFIYSEAERKFNSEIVRDRGKFRKSLPFSDVKDRNILLIDDGCETGLSILCALKSMINLEAKKVSLALPLIPDDLFSILDLKLDKIYAKHVIENFISSEYYYQVLEKLPKKVVQYILESSEYYMPYKKEKN
jgi:putative phosphoribosyl transferase